MQEFLIALGIVGFFINYAIMVNACKNFFSYPEYMTKPPEYLFNIKYLDSEETAEQWMHPIDDWLKQSKKDKRTHNLMWGFLIVLCFCCMLDSGYSVIKMIKPSYVAKLTNADASLTLTDAAFKKLCKA
jgi:hypothetical protein